MAMEAEHIKQLICAAFADADVTIQDLSGDGEHYAVDIAGKFFRGKSLVQQHRMVYAALEGYMGEKLHALALKTSAL